MMRLPTSKRTLVLVVLVAWCLFFFLPLPPPSPSPSTTNHSSNGSPDPAKVAAAVKEADYANYFYAYAFLYHQKEMLSDRVRMDAYHASIFHNLQHFDGKVILDVGTGSGILAIWAAQAGAKKVYAVEATNMAQHARQLAAGNGVEHVVEVIEGSIEDINIPEKVDVIISEWMGYFLVRESMFDSVIHARDRWLKPDGVMYPSQARMWLAPIKSTDGDLKNQDYESAMVDWDGFVQNTEDYYGVDMSILTEAYRDEKRKHILQTSLWHRLYPNQIIGTPVVVKEFDCHTATLDDVAIIHSEFRIPITAGQTDLSGFAGWFDVHFGGNKNNPVSQIVELTTAPSFDNSTHWGQQVFVLYPAVPVNGGDLLEGTLNITRAKKNHRLMDVEFTHHLKRSSGENTPRTISNFYIE